MSELKWACGVTTVPQRRENLLRRTLASLVAAGFNRPRIFVDGDSASIGWTQFDEKDVTFRHTAVGNFGNWALGLAELYLRNPKSDRYAMFEDDVVLCKNVRQYMENSHVSMCAFYLNLYTTEDNKPTGPFERSLNLKEGKIVNEGWFPSQQLGRGALALMFNRDSVIALLGSKRLWTHAEDRHRGRYLIDGTVLNVLAKAGIKEWVHCPSLAQHTGTGGTTIPNRLSPTLQMHMTAPSFPGEEHDAMEFLK